MNATDQEKWSPLCFKFDGGPKKKDPQMQLVDGIANIPRLGDKEYLQCGVLMVTTDPGFM